MELIRHSISRNATQDIKISTFDFTFGFVGRIFYEKGINELSSFFLFDYRKIILT